ncbi:hypothetical protein Pint_22617 [Pistacia integerrima]|uniref:Uncharacterized protein n=1 Tax=Pistacia integerrima TaxID=434235 RepID=A0ACC0YLV4_9ROSI|nr:hypothetical protein Pint_22617 [Pistacia integerrima]
MDLHYEIFSEIFMPFEMIKGGRGGGYKELDEEELEETKRRRREAEDDGELYDEFGNLKKKFRAKTQQAEAGRVLPGAGRAGWDVEELGISCVVLLNFSHAWLIEMGEREAEIGEGKGKGMIGKAARVGIVMIGRGVEAERGIEVEIKSGIMIMIETENMDETGTESGIVIEVGRNTWGFCSVVLLDRSGKISYVGKIA